MGLKSSNSPLVVDLFCGAGGLSTGLQQAGFRPVLAVDIDKHAAATYRANHPNTVVINDDIANVTPEHLFAASNGDEIDLVAGGPSCQGYSTTGKRNEDDPRNFLFRHFARLVKEVRPKYFLMENVKGLLTYRKGHFRDIIHEAFADSGYRVVSAVLCAADFGVPQLRNRIVFLGTRLDAPLSFPDPTHGQGSLWLQRKPHVTVEEAIGDLPLLNGDLNRKLWPYASQPQSEFQCYARENNASDYVTLHQANGMSDVAREVVRLISEGQGIRSVPPELLPARFHIMRRVSNGNLRKDCTTLYHRLSRKRPAYTITCYFRNVASGPFVHPVEDRSLSYREAARLMSFPDDYVFVPPSLTRQIGNAVPPLLARALGQHILALMDNHLPESRPNPEHTTAYIQASYA